MSGWVGSLSNPYLIVRLFIIQVYSKSKFRLDCIIFGLVFKSETSQCGQLVFMTFHIQCLKQEII